MIKQEIQTAEEQVGFDAMSYFKGLSEKNKLTKSLGFKAVSCSGPLSLEGVIGSMKHARNFIAIDDTNDGVVRESGGGYFKCVTYTVWILAKYKALDMNDRQEKLNLCRKIYKQFLSRILKDKYNWSMDFSYLLTGSIDTREMSSWFLDGVTGVEFHLDIDQPIELVYDASEWE